MKHENTKLNKEKSIYKLLGDWDQVCKIVVFVKYEHDVEIVA